MHEIIKEINLVRNKYPMKGKKDEMLLSNISKDLKSLPFSSENSLIKKFIDETLDKKLNQIMLVDTKKHINSIQGNFIFSFFDVSYFPSLSLDGLFYHKLKPDCGAAKNDFDMIEIGLEVNSA